jgi:hypothetical protein
LEQPGWVALQAGVVLRLRKGAPVVLIPSERTISELRCGEMCPFLASSAKLFASRFATLPSTLSLHFEAVKFACFAIEPEQINGENHQQGHRSNDTIPKDRLPKPVVEVPKS